MLNLILAVLITGISQSCSEDDVETDCINGEIAYIDQVDAPETGKVNEAIPISVSFSMKNTCGSFNNFRETSTEEGLIIEVYADYFGCTCGQAIVKDTQTYEFTPTAPGQLQLNFRAGPDELITVNIEVTE